MEAGLVSRLSIYLAVFASLSCGFDGGSHRLRCNIPSQALRHLMVTSSITRGKLPEPLSERWLQVLPSHLIWQYALQAYTTMER